jgi:hypothetical protein
MCFSVAWPLSTSNLNDCESTSKTATQSKSSFEGWKEPWNSTVVSLFVLGKESVACKVGIEMIERKLIRNIFIYSMGAAAETGKINDQG